MTFESIIGITCKEVFDEQTGHGEKVITETKDKTKNLRLSLMQVRGKELITSL